VTIWAETSLYAPTIRKGEYFRGELPVNNSTGAMWLTITNVAVLNNGANPDIVTNTTGNVLLARTPEVFKYDADGNLTSDSLWTNLWNAENRRTTIESTTGVPSAGRMKEQWTHLADGRWIERIVSTWNGSAYVASYTNRYVWDAQVLLAVLDHTNGLVMSFMRGLDLSGSLQGAGGVGGVLAVSFKTNGTHFFCYDGNGNVAALVSATSGSESARYEYGPFAEPVRMTGPLAKPNPIRFSTQYADDVTGDLKYLFRDYRSDMGRWYSRDPIEENAGPAVYVFVKNRVPRLTDSLGLATWTHHWYHYYSAQGEMEPLPDGRMTAGKATTGTDHGSGNLKDGPDFKAIGCCFNLGLKFVDIDYQTWNKIYYAGTWDEANTPHEDPVTGKTYSIQQHETRHGQVFKTFYQNVFALWQSIEGRCMIHECQLRFLDYEAVMKDYLAEWTNYENAKIEIEDYGGIYNVPINVPLPPDTVIRNYSAEEMHRIQPLLNDAKAKYERVCVTPAGGSGLPEFDLGL
jgi:RHS repeat-associated protein